MTDIQNARDVFKKWRESATRFPWERRYSDFGTVRQELTGYPIADNVDDADARLIVGIAGNPDLLDAIDEALDMANSLDGTAYGVAERLAAAILFADSRMQQ